MANSDAPLQVRVARIASRRYGIVDATDLAAVGVAGSTLDRWLRAGRIHRLHRGVFSVIPPPMLTQEGRWLAAVKAGGPNAFLSHGPAGQLQWLLDRRERLALHVSLADRSRRKLPGIVIHRPRSLPPADTTTFLKVPATTPTRIIWDLAAVLPSLPLRRAFEKAERNGKLRRPRLRELLENSPTHKGAGAIRELLARRVVPLAEVRSWLEGLLHEICTEHSIPFPAVNVPLLGYEVDFLWESARVVVEADGGDHLSASQRDRDNQRDTDLQRAGHLVRRYSSSAVGDDERVASELLAILRERGVLR